MKTLTKIGGIAGIVLALAGCNQNSPNYAEPGKIATKKGEISISVKPVSVAFDENRYGYNDNGILSAVVESDPSICYSSHKKYWLATTNSGQSQNFVKAASLIQSEISDGDNENIELIGYFEKDSFIIKTLKANGYQVDF